MVFSTAQAESDTTIRAVRLWSAADYTRVTFEATQPIHSTLFSIANPDRLVLDLEGIKSMAPLQAMAAQLRPSDPYLRSIRVGHFKPGVVRVVFDLKTLVKVSTASMDPVGDYGYRLLVDIYPANHTPLPPSTKADNPALQVQRSDFPPSLTQDKPMAQAQPPDAVAPTTAPLAVADPLASLLSQSVPQPLPTKSSSQSAEQAQAPTLPAPMAQVESTPAPRPMASRLLIVAVDAGHGGEDPGAHGLAGTHEKDVTLAIARRLKAVIDSQPGLHAVLTRDGDYFIPLQERTAKAHRLHADLFVSVHADAYINREARGSSVFALSEKGATSVAARWLAKHENEADLIGGVTIAPHQAYLAQTLFDLSQTATINDGLKMAHAVLGELDQINVLHRGFVEQAGFAVLKSPDIPSILVETAFITNPEEERHLNDPDYQQKLAQAITHGLQDYLKKTHSWAHLSALPPDWPRP